MDKIISSSLEKYPLTGEDIHGLTKGSCNIFKYSALEPLSLETILGKNKCAIILLEYAGRDIGHWVLLFKNKDDSYTFYNSLGYPIDYQMQPPILSMKLMGKKIYNNNAKIQSKASDINTCGRWCILRLNYRNLTNQQFNKLLTQNKCYSPDFWVTICSTNFLDF
jgi:hypothetical protein